MMAMLLLLLLAVLLSQKTVRADAPLGIPGTTQTMSGYDTELGTDPICWSSVASPTPESGVPFPNGELVENFTLADKVKLQPRCPAGTWLEVFAPLQFFGQNNKGGSTSVPITANFTEEYVDGILTNDVSRGVTLANAFRPRTFEWYNFTVRASIDLTSTNGSYIVSDSRRSLVAVSVVACDSVTAGFCSPFVHEQANIREARIEASFTPEQAAAAALKPKRKAGDSHGGTHVHAPAVLVDLDTVDVTENGRYEFSVDVPMIINQPGNFFVIGTLQYFTGEQIDGPPKFRYDVANALSLEEHIRFVTFQDPPVILKVSDTVLTVSYVCVGTACCVILYMLSQTLRHYKSQVLQISQAPFLVMFQVSALIATASSVLYDPRSDVWCNLAQPLVYISLQIMYSVTFGRLWRIHAVVSPLLRNRLRRASLKKGILDHVGIGSVFCPSYRTSIRREVTSSKVWLIVVFCTLPQIILQALAVGLQPLFKSVEFNIDESTGRCVCDNDVERKKSIHLYSTCVLFALVLALLVMAHIARQLPNLLNESSVIYDSTVTSILLTIVGVCVLSVTNDPTTSPDVSYMIHVILILSVTLTFSVRIMMPKLRMVWNGQVILVSKLVSDHRQSLESSKVTSDRTCIMHGVTGFNPSDNTNTQNQISGSGGSGLNSSTNSGPNISSLIRQDTNDIDESERTNGEMSDRMGDDSFVGRVGDLNILKNSNTRRAKLSDTVPMEEESSDTSSPTTTSHHVAVKVDDSKANSSQVSKDGKGKVTFKADADKYPEDQTNGNIPVNGRTKNQRKSCNIVVREGETPSKRLTVKMLDLQSELDHVIQQIMSGLAVDKSDWEAVRRTTAQLDEVWSLVQFDWQANDDGV